MATKPGIFTGGDFGPPFRTATVFPVAAAWAVQQSQEFNPTQDTGLPMSVDQPDTEDGDIHEERDGPSRRRTLLVKLELLTCR